MNHVVFLSGGNGSRVGEHIPKQYLIVNNKALFMYSLEIVVQCELVDDIVVVADNLWVDFINKQIHTLDIQKPIYFVEPGLSRQESNFNGIKYLYNHHFGKDDIVINVDAVYPNLSIKMIEECIDEIADCDGVLHYYPCDMTLFGSKDKKYVESAPSRDNLVCGVIPESFKLGKFYECNLKNRDRLGLIRSSSELAYNEGFIIKLIECGRDNYKITTKNDLARFREMLTGKPF